MTTPSINPVHYLKQAWSRTHSTWGKVAIVLFYSFVWAEIVWGVQIMIAPLVVFPCYNAHATESEILLAGSLLRQLILFAIGLLLYADRGGIALWNVGMVLSIFAINTCLFFAMMIPYATLDNFVTCNGEHQTLINIKFAFLAWITVAFICSLDEASKVIVDNEMAHVHETTPPPPFNPIYYIKKAWNSSNSTWGKISTALFYSWVWLNIIMAIVSVCNPLMGLPCFQQHFLQGDFLVAETYIRELNIYAIGFLLYAERGGIQRWNISMVLVFYIVWTLLVLYDILPSMQELDQFATCGDDFASMQSGSWTVLVWLALALVGSLVDTRMSVPATADETSPLNA